MALSQARSGPHIFNLQLQWQQTPAMDCSRATVGSFAQRRISGAYNGIGPAVSQVRVSVDGWTFYVHPDGAITLSADGMTADFDLRGFSFWKVELTSKQAGAGEIEVSLHQKIDPE